MKLLYNLSEKLNKDMEPNSTVIYIYIYMYDTIIISSLYIYIYKYFTSVLIDCGTACIERELRTTVTSNKMQSWSMFDKSVEKIIKQY